MSNSTTDPAAMDPAAAAAAMAAMMNGPSIPPPPGITPNFDNPPNQNGLAMFVFVFCSVVTTLCVMIRAYGRVYLMKTFKLEEGLVVAAFGLYWGSLWAALGVYDIPGYFVHAWDVRLKDLIPMTYYIFVMGNTYVVALALLKIAMLSEWSHVLVPRGSRTKSVFWWSCIAMIIIQAMACIGIVVALNLQCIPHEASWDFTIVGAKCYPLPRIQLASGIIYLVTDVIMFFMPQHVIWSLQMSWKKRLGVSIVFGLGLLACIAAAFRLQVTLTYGSATDATYNIAELAFWVFAEMACGFFVICVPCIPKIFQETPSLRRAWRALGLTTGGTKGTKPVGKSGRATGHTAKKSGVSLSSGNFNSANNSMAGKSYLKLDDGLPMEEFQKSESTEHLRQDDKQAQMQRRDGRGGEHIIRTTMISVEEQSRTRHHEQPRSKQEW